MHKTILFLSIFVFLLAVSASTAHAQTRRPVSTPSQSPIGVTVTTPDQSPQSDSPESSASAEAQKLEELKKEDITKPEETEGKSEILDLFAKRPITSLTPFNFIAFTVQYAVSVGVPANTIILIMLLPFLATFAAFVRHIIGLPSLELLVPIALSITIVSTGIAAGSILLIAIILASAFGRFILKRVRIMQLPKKALSIFLISIFVFIAITISAANGIVSVKQLSIFPILLLILLGEKITSLQLSRSLSETLIITVVTVLMGLFGFFILSTEVLRQLILLYPELIIVLIPINIAIGRYFGLRLTEVYRFSGIKRHGNK